MNLIELRLSKNLTQTQLANELGVKRTSISMWENKKAFPKYDSLQKLADLFECSIDAIIKAIKKEMPLLPPRIPRHLNQTRLHR